MNYCLLAILIGTSLCDITAYGLIRGEKGDQIPYEDTQTYPDLLTNSGAGLIWYVRERSQRGLIDSDSYENIVWTASEGSDTNIILIAKTFDYFFRSWELDIELYSEFGEDTPIYDFRIGATSLGTRLNHRQMIVNYYEADGGTFFLLVIIRNEGLIYDRIKIVVLATDTTTDVPVGVDNALDALALGISSSDLRVVPHD